MSVTRLPTKFGQGHTDGIAFFQDVVLQNFIENKFTCLVLRGLLDNGDEVQFTMTDDTGKRSENTRLLGLIAELQAELVRELAPGGHDG